MRYRWTGILAACASHLLALVPMLLLYFGAIHVELDGHGIGPLVVVFAASGFRPMRRPEGTQEQLGKYGS